MLDPPAVAGAIQPLRLKPAGDDIPRTCHAAPPGIPSPGSDRPWPTAERVPFPGRHAVSADASMRPTGRCATGIAGDPIHGGTERENDAQRRTEDTAESIRLRQDRTPAMLLHHPGKISARSRLPQAMHRGVGGEITTRGRHTEWLRAAVRRGSLIFSRRLCRSFVSVPRVHRGAPVSTPIHARSCRIGAASPSLFAVINSVPSCTAASCDRAAVPGR